MEDVEAFGIGLHQPVRDAVMHHLAERPGAVRPAMDVAALGRAALALTVRRRLDRAASRCQRVEDRIEALNDVAIAADHHAIAALQSPNAAARSDIDIEDALRPERTGASYVVLIEGIAAIDDAVAG